jgi:ribonuclease PH
VTADYVMLPASTPQRKDWPKIGHTDSRGTEIQRIIGRTLRAVLDLTKLGPHTIHVDCQVLQADGGTRTASICGAYVALADAVGKLPRQVPLPRNPALQLAARYQPACYDPSKVLVDELAAVSVGIVEGELMLDLDYNDDVRATVDMNIAWTRGGKYVEVQGSAENGQGFDRGQLSDMIDLATEGCRGILEVMREALREGSVMR